jgi:DNA polymerase I-like protein with 3'-5' exonuclease and polymerase domains
VWLAKHWNITEVNQTFDTHLAGSLLDENRSNSLETHAKIYTPMGGYDSEFNRKFDKSRMDLIPPAELLPYAGGDTDACFRVDRRQRQLLSRDTRLTRFFQKILLPASKVFAKVERRGVLVDDKKYAELKIECEREIKLLTKEAFSHIPRRLLLKYADNLSLTRPALLREFMFTKRGLNLDPVLLTPKAQAAFEAGDDSIDKVENASTAGEHLQRFISDERAKPFIEAMEKLGSANKTMSTYIVGFLKHLRSDGYFHPTYRLGRGSSADDPEGGTVTGRLSATDPAYQTLVKRGAWAKRLRSVYPCPPGHGIAKFDFGQGELRIMAIVANDPTMLHAYHKGLDLHALTAAAMMGLTFEQFMLQPEDLIEENRRAAKAVNFGLLYGMKPPGLVDYARKSYGVDMQLKQAEHYSNAFFGQYNRLLPYHEEIKRVAHKHEMVRNPLGRIRHLPLINGPDRDIRSLAERQAINSPIQSCLSDMMLLAMVEIDRRWPDLWIFGMTHDSVEMYLPLENITERATEVRDVLQNLPLKQFDWNPGIRFVADAEIALEGTLADVKKVKL